MMRKIRRDRGQALVLVLLALAVVLTIVLYILSRSITDISVSSGESQAVSAFSAAEAGVEQSLVIGSDSSNSVGSAQYDAKVTNVAQNLGSFVYPMQLNTGDSLTLWLKSQDSSASFAGTNVTICWGKAGTYSDPNLEPAIETILFYESTANTPSTAKVSRAAFDPNTSRATVGSGSVSPNGFASPDSSNGTCVIDSQTFQFQKTISLSGIPNPEFMFVRMFYNTDTSQPIAFSSTDGIFPTQGILVDSSGTSGQSSRKVEVFQSWPEIPNVFQFALFSYSSTGLVK